MPVLILGVESDAGTRRLLEVLLRRGGFDPDLVAETEDALALFRFIDYQAVIVDLVLGEEPGFAILDWIATNRPSLTERTLVLSSAHPTQLRRLAESYPAAHIVTKPFEVVEFEQTISRLASGCDSRESDFAAAFARRSMAAGAGAGVAVRRNPIKPDVLECVTSFGYTPKVIAEWFPISADALFPLAAAVRDSRPVYIESPDSAASEYPTVAHAFREYRSVSLAALPVMRSGRTIGAVGWSFREPRHFGGREQSHLLKIAEHAEDFLESAGESHLFAEEEPRRGGIG
ncbi:MAG: response regulator [Acidobacteriota bacterium]